jgi:hypothetical protein
MLVRVPNEAKIYNFIGFNVGIVDRRDLWSILL